MANFLPTAITDALSGYLWDTATSTLADLARGAAHFIEPLGDPGMPWPPDLARRETSYPGKAGAHPDLFTGTGGNVDVYTAVRGHTTLVDPELGQDALTAEQRAEIIRNQGFSGLGENKVFITPDRSRALAIMAETDPWGQYKADPEKYIFKGSVSRDQLDRGLVKNALGEWEAIVDPSQADKIFGTGGVQQTTTGKVIPTNRFFGYNIENLLGKSRAAKEALSDIPGIQTAKDLIADTGLGKYVEPWKQPLVKALGGFARFMPVVSTPLDVIAGTQHAREAASATDPISEALSNIKSRLAFISAVPGVDAIPYIAELGVGALERTILGDYLNRNEAEAPGSTYVEDPDYDPQAVQSVINEESRAVQDAIRESQQSGRLSRFFRSAEGSGIDLDKIKEDERAGEFGAKFYTPAQTSSGMGGDVDFGSNIAQALATGVIDRGLAQALGIRTTPFGQTTISQEGLPPGVPFPESVTDLPQEVQEPWETRDTWEAAINQILPESVTDLPPAGGLPPLPYLGDAEQFVEMGDLFGGTTMGVSPPVQETPASVLPSGFGGRELANMGGISLAEPGRWSTVETTPAEDKEQYMATQDALKAEQDRIREENRIAEETRLQQVAEQAKLDRERQEKAASDARQAEEAARRAREQHEATANRIREEAIKHDKQVQADDKKAIARENRLAEQAREREKEEAAKARQAVDAARLNALAEASRKQAAAEKKRADDLLAKQMADMFKSMEETRKRQEELNAQRLREQAHLSSFTAPARPTYSPRRFGPH